MKPGLIILAALLGPITASAALAEEKKPAAHAIGVLPFALTPTMQNAIKPESLPKLADEVLSNPMGMLNNPSSNCAQCHTSEDLSRFNKTIFPMLKLADPSNWMNPQTFTSVMTPMMNPATYMEWMTAYMKKASAFYSPGS